MEQDQGDTADAARAAPPSERSPQAVSGKAGIPIAVIDEIMAALIWCHGQAHQIMQITAVCAAKHGDSEDSLGMVNSCASDIAINLEMAAQALTAQHQPGSNQ